MVVADGVLTIPPQAKVSFEIAVIPYPKASAIMRYAFFHSRALGRVLLGLSLLGLHRGCGFQPRSHIERSDVSATVTSAGTPLSGALIDFSNPENGEAYGGTLDAEGYVHLRGIAIGDYTVTVQPPPGDPLPDGPRKSSAAALPIPRQFQNPQLSPLHASVSESEAAFTFDLKNEAYQRKP